jgi:predicted HicB family RNase H-like nuclease
MLFINVIKSNNKIMEKNLNVRISKELLDKYKIYCNKKGYSISKRIRNFITQELKTK